MKNYISKLFGVKKTAKQQESTQPTNQTAEQPFTANNGGILGAILGDIMSKKYTEEERLQIISEYRQQLISNPDERIKNLIDGIKNKLSITESIEEVVDRWDDKNPRHTSFFYCIKDVDKYIENFIEECRDSINDSDEKLPWDDVLASICIMPQNVRVTDIECPHCREKIVVLQFLSPIRTWENLCGTGGLLAICPNCPKQISYKSTIRN